MESHLLEDLRDGVLTLTMNRPEARNALSLEMSELLTQALRGRRCQGHGFRTRQGRDLR